MAQPRQHHSVAVIGTGNMGQNHVRGYSNLKNIDLIGVYDSHTPSAMEMAEQYGCLAFQNIEDIVGKVDAVSICSPSSTHVEHGLFMLNYGIHCLIEKPLATTQEDCIALISAAKKSGAVLMVGHIERFNPAVQTLEKIMKSGNHKIHAINTSRMSMTSERITDVDVIADLMIHDLDIVMFLVGEAPASVVANSTSVRASKDVDFVNALLNFDSGTIANLTASRITQNKIRTLSVSADFGYIEIDYINQDLHIYHQNSDVKLGPNDTYTLDIASERVLVRRTEPLMLELQNFFDAISGHDELKVTGADGLAVLSLVRQIQSLVG